MSPFMLSWRRGEALVLSLLRRGKLEAPTGAVISRPPSSFERYGRMLINYHFDLLSLSQSFNLLKKWLVFSQNGESCRSVLVSYV